ncbi:cytochrome C oxidase subunit ctag [Bacillus sp. OxB-1]|nr:cytochrome c oxidase assembly factor CtaG [Bacillus sp. OxB-1]BAQ10396.1 cytochrome C oxidase subunit ctag [Bacillus sp. OxB-1]
MPLSIFGFRALWSPWFFLTLVLLMVLYFLLTVKWRDRIEGAVPVTKKEIIYFSVAMLLLYIVKGSPVDLLGHILFYVHMIQMAVLLFLIAPLFIMGIPNWMWQKVLDTKIIGKIFTIFTKPIVSIIIFALMFSLYHYPDVLDEIKLSLIYHAIFTITLFLSAVFFWWSLVNTMPNQKSVHSLLKIGLMILSTILITPACALIIFNPNPMYLTYASGEAWLQSMALCVPAGMLSGLAGLGISGPEMFSNMSTIYDQQLGGIIMKIVQEIIYMIFLGKFFLAWHRNERDNADEITEKALIEHQRLSMYNQPNR